jgi:hypothetical protein
MTFNLLVIVIGLCGVLFFTSALRRFRLRRLMGGALRLIVSLALFLVVAAALVVAADIKTYQRLIAEQPAGELQFTRLGFRQYNGAFTYPSGERTDFALRGDEWQIDARLIKWHAFANLVGFDTLYRLDRISGRYTNAEDERSQLRTVYPLAAPERVDVWDLVQRLRAFIPWVDAYYGSATFLPMADGAHYKVTISSSGIIARPLNQVASAAVGNWHSGTDSRQ